MLEYRQFLAEGYDSEDKKEVIKDFAKYLDDKLATEYDVAHDRHVNDKLWWSIGTGDGKYLDTRITVGTRASTRQSEAEWQTLNFLVSDMGKLTAYLDAEDNDLLNNTPVFDAVSEYGDKAYASWSLGATKEAEEKAFANAVELINKFFASHEIADMVTNDAISKYSDEDKERLDKMIDSRAEQKYIKWTRDDEKQLNAFYDEKAKLKKAIEYLTAEMDTATEEKNTSLQTDIANKLADLQKRLEDVKIDIKDLETDKLVYYKATDRKLDREITQQRNLMIGALGLSDEEAVGYTNDQLSDMLHKTFTKSGKKRKQRAIKTGDIKDAAAAEQAAEKKKEKAETDAAMKKFLELRKQRRAAK